MGVPCWPRPPARLLSGRFSPRRFQSPSGGRSLRSGLVRRRIIRDTCLPPPLRHALGRGTTATKKGTQESLILRLFCKPICKPDMAKPGETGETEQTDRDVICPVRRGGCTRQRLLETPETHVVVLIIQRPHLLVDGHGSQDHRAINVPFARVVSGQTRSCAVNENGRSGYIAAIIPAPYKRGVTTDG
jgi:hypothetical protein